MSVRIVRLRSGEDVICDLYEVTSNADGEDEKDKTPVAYQLRHPHSIFIRPGMNVDVDGDNIHKLSNPEVVMEPWLPLSKNPYIFFRIDEVVAAYETHDTVIEQYNSLIEAQENGSEDATPDTEE